MFHVKRCFRQKNNLALRDRLRLLEPVRPPQHLILQAVFRKTQMPCVSRETRLRLQRYGATIRLTPFHEIDVAITAKRYC